MQYVASAVDNFTLAWDLGIAIFLFIAAFFYGFSAGQKRLALFLRFLERRVFHNNHSFF